MQHFLRVCLLLSLPAALVFLRGPSVAPAEVVAARRLRDAEDFRRGRSLFFSALAAAVWAASALLAAAVWARKRRSLAPAQAGQAGKGGRRKKISVLGSTGSVGRQTLQVAREFRERLDVVEISGHSNVALLLEQLREFRPRAVAVGDAETAERLWGDLTEAERGRTRIYVGPEQLSEMVKESEAEMVVTGIVGTAGLLPTMAALESGKDIALANKETLIAAGPVIAKKLASGRGVSSRILPSDSEHNALFQCMQGIQRHEAGTDSQVAKLILTASGGPFRDLTQEQLEQVTPEMALKHPTYSMGAKISVDSATLMNKGLEVIEAHNLFQIPYDRIQAVIHPESIVHSAVEMADGSVLAQMGHPDMKMPILHCLSYPERWTLKADSQIKRLNLETLNKLTFKAIDQEKFPCFAMAVEAGKRGGTAPAVISAANEVAVEKFLKKEIRFTDIPRVLAAVMKDARIVDDPSLEDVLAADKWARSRAADIRL